MSGIFADEVNQQHGLLWEIWRNIPNYRLSDFTGNIRFNQEPDAVRIVPSADVAIDQDESYGARVRAVLSVPVSGEYEFWIASDDGAELYLAENGSKFAKRKVAQVSEYVERYGWDVNPEQYSGKVLLTAGQTVFVEVLYKRWGGETDHLSIAWKPPGGARQVIPVEHFQPYAGDPLDTDNDELPDAWELQHGFAVEPNAPGNSRNYRSADPDQDGYSNLEESLNGTDPNVHGGVPGYLLREAWYHLEGSNVNNLTWSSRFYQRPDKNEFVTSARGPLNESYDYGQRIRGSVVIPESGNYVFTIAGDNNCELWLSSTSSEFDKARVAYVPGFSGIEEWDKYPMQQSASIFCTTGQKIYIEILHKQATSEDHVQVGWLRPSSSEIEVIESQFLESHAYDLKDPDGDEMPREWELAHGLNPDGADEIDLDHDGIPNALEYAQQSDPRQPNQIHGALSDERWLDVPGRFIHDLVRSSKFYQVPDRVTLLTYTLTPRVTDERYGRRVRGTVTPAISGNYSFWALGDEEVEVWLSPNEKPFDKKLIVRTMRTSEFDEELTQKSQSIQLIAGQTYYIEALQKDEYGLDVFGLAWTDPNGDRMLIPSLHLSSFVKIPEDLDDDCLPDEWEAQQGLNLTDNGLVDLVKQGERGDFDSDGLNNRTEYLIGSDPKNPDTDGDGELDGVEFYSLETNPMVINTITDRLVGTVALGELVSSTVGWVMTSGGLLADSFRGEGTWNFQVPSDGNWLLRLDAELVGSHYGDESVPIVVKINGKTVARKKICFGSGNLAVLRTLTPWLSAGNHQVSILIDNAVARRSVRLASLKVYESSSNQEILAASNRIVSHPPSSRVSPAFIEGYARDASGVQVNNSAAIVGIGEGHWFTNLVLPDHGNSVTYSLSFEQGYTAQGSLAWQATNVMAGESLVIRVGDSLRIGAWSESSPSAAVSSSLGDSWTFTGSETTTVSFPNSGSFSFNATSGTATANLTVHVVASPNFSTESVDLLDGATRHLIYDAPPAVVFDAPESLASIIVTPNGTNQRKVSILAGRGGDFHVAARLGKEGPILGIQRCNTILISDALQNDLTSVFQSDIPGYRLFTAPLTVLNFPNGARIDVRINRAGVMFADGSSLMSVVPADLTNGWVPLNFLFPLSLQGGYCHSLLVYDRNGVFLGIR